MRARVVVVALALGAPWTLGACGGDADPVTTTVAGPTTTVQGPTVTVAPADVVDDSEKGVADTPQARDAEKLVLDDLGDGEEVQGTVTSGFQTGPDTVCVERIPRDQVQLEPEQQRLTHVRVTFPDRRIGRAQDGPC